jgi:hypothetical protein
VATNHSEVQDSIAELRVFEPTAVGSKDGCCSQRVPNKKVLRALIEPCLISEISPFHKVTGVCQMILIVPYDPFLAMTQPKADIIISNEVKALFCVLLSDQFVPSDVGAIAMEEDNDTFEVGFGRHSVSN